jgi:SAM-dependent methyltransferase
MDYRKPVIFGENWSPSRYKVLPYFAVEKAVMEQAEMQRILDFGCAAGWNMSRFRQNGRYPLGIDVVPERVALAAHHGPVAIASGLQLPFADESFDLIYIQHVLHHIGDVGQALAEVRRCCGRVACCSWSKPSKTTLSFAGAASLPKWLGDEVNAPFYFAELKETLGAYGFAVETAQQYSVLFWLWEILPDHMPIMEKLTPLFVGIEQLLQKWFNRYSAHCFYVLVKA